MTVVPVWYVSDNGFSSREEMDRLHWPIVELAVAVLSHRPGNVLDLGCGNGVLLNKIHAARPDCVPYGVDSDPKRIAHARALWPPFAANFSTGDLFDPVWAAGRRYSLAILMPGRLIEAGPARSAKLKEQLKESCDAVLVYAYDDWIAQYGSLRNLAGNAGIKLQDWSPNAPVAIADLPEAEAD